MLILFDFKFVYDEDQRFPQRLVILFEYWFYIMQVLEITQASAAEFPKYKSRRNTYT